MKLFYMSAASNLHLLAAGGCQETQDGETTSLEHHMKFKGVTQRMKEFKGVKRTVQW